MENVSEGMEKGFDSQNIRRKKKYRRGHEELI